jgi:hypothetical protein
MRGEGNKQQKANITTDYEKPTRESWLSFCKGIGNHLANTFLSADPELMTCM